MPKISLVSLVGLVSIIIIIVINLILTTTYAQSDIAGVYDISDKDAKDGDLMTFDPDNGIIRAGAPYSSHLFGILKDNPLAVYRRVDNSGKPIVRSGMINVNVTTLNGPIKSGDYITSSDIAGMGMKATDSGYAIGIANGSFDEKSGNSTAYQGKTIRSGTVPVTIGLVFADISAAGGQPGSSILNQAGNSLIKNIQTPQGFDRLMKFILAGLIMLIAIIFAFITLIRAIPKAIEAVGRNPLAKKSINLSLALNIGFIIVMIMVAALVTILVLRV